MDNGTRTTDPIRYPIITILQLFPIIRVGDGEYFRTGPSSCLFFSVYVYNYVNLLNAINQLEMFSLETKILKQVACCLNELRGQPLYSRKSRPYYVSKSHLMHRGQSRPRRPISYLWRWTQHGDKVERSR